MATTSYPNVTVNSTTFVLLPDHNGLTIVSTQGSAGSVIANYNLPAGYSVFVVQMGAGVITATAGTTAATVNGLGGVVVTGGQYGGLTLTAVTDGNFVVTAVS